MQQDTDVNEDKVNLKNMDSEYHWSHVYDMEINPILYRLACMYIMDENPDLTYTDHSTIRAYSKQVIEDRHKIFEKIKKCTKEDITDNEVPCDWDCSYWEIIFNHLEKNLTEEEYQLLVGERKNGKKVYPLEDMYKPRERNLSIIITERWADEYHKRLKVNEKWDITSFGDYSIDCDGRMIPFSKEDFEHLIKFVNNALKMDRTKGDETR